MQPFCFGALAVFVFAILSACRTAEQPADLKSVRARGVGSAMELRLVDESGAATLKVTFCQEQRPEAGCTPYDETTMPYGDIEQKLASYLGDRIQSAATAEKTLHQRLKETEAQSEKLNTLEGRLEAGALHTLLQFRIDERKAYEEAKKAIPELAEMLRSPVVFTTPGRTVFHFGDEDSPFDRDRIYPKSEVLVGSLEAVVRGSAFPQPMVSPIDIALNRRRLVMTKTTKSVSLHRRLLLEAEGDATYGGWLFFQKGQQIPPTSIAGLVKKGAAEQAILAALVEKSGGDACVLSNYGGFLHVANLEPGTPILPVPYTSDVILEKDRAKLTLKGSMRRALEKDLIIYRSDRIQAEEWRARIQGAANPVRVNLNENLVRVECAAKKSAFNLQDLQRVFGDHFAITLEDEPVRR